VEGDGESDGESDGEGEGDGEGDEVVDLWEVCIIERLAFFAE